MDPIVELKTSHYVLLRKKEHHVSLEIIVTKKGEERKKLKLVNKSTSFSDLIEHLNPTLNILFATTLWLGGRTSSSKLFLRIF
jgi:hypothetical protein